MALDFPSNPVNGQVYGTYTYDSIVGVWRTTPDLASGMPAGTIVQWPGATAPANWMIADGSAISRTTYASLFSAIGTQYGAGDGSTTFNLPNLKGRVAAGLDSSQSEFNTLGETGGAKTHTLLTAEMPSHTHTQDSHTHTYSGSTNTTGAHTHTLTGSNGGSSGVGFSITSNNNNDFLFGPMNGSRANSAGDHSHTYSGTTSAQSAATNQNTGGGGAHNNLQPYIVLNYIIKLSAGVTAGDSELATRVGTTETKINSTPLSQNYVINGGYDWWQRGVSFTAAGYTADRWIVLADGTGATRTISRQTFAPGNAITGYEPTYYMRYAQSVAGSAATYNLFEQRIEDVRTCAGKSVTVSFWAKSDAIRTITSQVQQNFGTGGSAEVQAINPASIALTTSWQRFAFTATMPSISGKTIGTNAYVALRVNLPTNATFTVDVWGVQFEEGTNATPFRKNAPSIQAELSACQRYYWQTVPGLNTYQQHAMGIATSTTGGEIYFHLPVQMRTVPTSMVSPNMQVIDSGFGGSMSSLSLSGSSGLSTVIVNFSGSGYTATRPVWIRNGNNASGYIGFSAEL